MSQVTLENVEKIFTFQEPRPDQVEAFKKIRAGCIDLANLILHVVPLCADRSTALRKLREVRMDCNAAIALDGQI